MLEGILIQEGKQVEINWVCTLYLTKIFFRWIEDLISFIQQVFVEHCMPRPAPRDKVNKKDKNSHPQGVYILMVERQ